MSKPLGELHRGRKMRVVFSFFKILGKTTQVNEVCEDDNSIA